MITAPVASAVTGRSKPQIYEALEQQTTGVLVPLSGVAAEPVLGSRRSARFAGAAGSVDPAPHSALRAPSRRGAWPTRDARFDERDPELRPRRRGIAPASL